MYEILTDLKDLYTKYDKNKIRALIKLKLQGNVLITDNCKKEWNAVKAFCLKHDEKEIKRVFQLIYIFNAKNVH